jgi:hypothetical protein
MPKSRRVTPVSKHSKRPKCKDADARGLPAGRKLGSREIAELNEMAKDYHWVLFGIGQLAVMLNIHPKLVSAVAGHTQSPFGAAGRRGRPEWVLKFLHEPPKGFEPPKL